MITASHTTCHPAHSYRLVFRMSFDVTLMIACAFALASYSRAVAFNDITTGHWCCACNVLPKSTAQAFKGNNCLLLQGAQAHMLKVSFIHVCYMGVHVTRLKVCSLRYQHSQLQNSSQGTTPGCARHSSGLIMHCSKGVGDRRAQPCIMGK
jgi:hypothetical protein